MMNTHCTYCRDIRSIHYYEKRSEYHTFNIKFSFSWYCYFTYLKWELLCICLSICYYCQYCYLFYRAYGTYYKRINERNYFSDRNGMSYIYSLILRYSHSWYKQFLILKYSFYFRAWYLYYWVLFLFIYLFWFLFGRNFLAVIINEDIAVSRGIKVSIYNLVFLLFLSLFIGMSIKIFWVLLIGAFLVIPANIGKILGNSIRSVFIISLVSAFSWVILWLFSSYFLWTSTWATIVLYLIWGFLIALILKSTKWKR